MFKILFLILFLFSNAFASGWQTTALIAVLASIFILSLIFIIAYVFNINELKFLVKEETIQLFGTALIIVSFAAVEAFLINLSTQLAGGEGKSLGEVALNKLNQIENSLHSLHLSLSSFAHSVGKSGSKSVYCSYGSVVFSVSTCGGFSILGASLPFFFQILSVAIGEINTLKSLLTLTAIPSSSILFTLLFPLGLFLRTFKLTRGAGGFLIAFGISLYLFVPFFIVLLDRIVEEITISTLKKKYNIQPSFSFSIKSCDEYDFSESNENAAIASFNSFFSSSSSFINNAIYYVVIKATFLLVFSIAVLAASVRALIPLMSAEIDISPITRLL